jgi:hypothetical protein
MSTSPSNSDRLEDTLESTRRSVRQLEIDAYRIRADLTRIEAELDAEGDRDPATLPRREVIPVPTPATPTSASVNALATTPRVYPIDGAPTITVPTTSLDWQASVAPSLPDGMNLLVGTSPQIAAPSVLETAPPSVIDPIATELASTSNVPTLQKRRYRRAARPFMSSLVVHAVILLLATSITVVTIVETRPFFTADLVELADEEPIEKLENVDVDQLGQLDDIQLQNTISDSAKFDVAGPLVDEVVPVDFQSVAGPANLGDMGAFSSLPTDLGTAMMGSGGLGADGTGAPSGLGSGNQRKGGGGARNGGPLGEALFFGTQSKGDRFVYVVDNSSSMKGGRLEMAVAELLKSVGGLSPKQSFYVIFVSDQTYPMFYPVPERTLLPATAANRERLSHWLPKAILASGKNRELIKAMDLAASLEPHAVFLLWDGDMKYSDKVRMDVMTHLTRPNQWKFAIHTLGFGINSLDSEYNLTTIAQAHGGTYRRVDVPTVPRR